MILLNASSDKFSFDGWSTKATGYGSVIDDETPLDSDLYVYPSYKLNVTVHAGGQYEIDKYTVDEGGLTYRFKIIDSTRYEFPDSDKIKVTCGSETVTPTIDQKARTITLTCDDILKGNVTIEITPYQPQYNIECNQQLAADHIECHFLEGIKPKKGDNYSFTIETSNGESTDDFDVPNTLNIKVGDTALTQGYTIIKEEGGSPKNATVNIEGKYINGDIIITAAAKRTDNFVYNIHNYGTIEYIEQEEMPTTGIYETIKDFKFSVQGSKTEYEETIKPENMLVNLNKKGWISVKEEMGKTARFTLENGEFCLKGGNATESLEIFVRSPDPDYDFMDNIQWSTIELFSSRGVAKDIFNLEEEKKVSYQGTVEYTARIIDFDHDDIEGTDKKAGITFELEELISNPKTKKAINKQYKNSFTKHFSSTLYNNYLNNEFLDNFDNDLSREIKTVKKKVHKIEYKSGFETYTTKCFPFAMSEIDRDYKKHGNYNEGELYKYYDIHDKSYRVKEDLNGDKHTYWLRTPEVFVTGDKESFTMNTRGNVQSKDSRNYDYAYMVAFAI